MNILFNHENISDYGCRKVLGLKSASSYINGISAKNQDSYISSRLKSKENKKALSFLALGGILAGVAIIASSIRKNKLNSALSNEANKLKNSAASASKEGLSKFTDKIKNLFKKSK